VAADPHAVEVRMSRSSLILLLLVFLTACDDPPPSPAPIPFKAALEAQDRERLRPKEDKKAAKEVVQAGPFPASTLKRGLPKLKRNSRYSWAPPSALIAGHLGARLMQGTDKTAGVDGLHVLTFIIDDLIDHPARRELLSNRPKVLGKFPGEVVQDAWINILVAERFEITVRGEHPDYLKTSKLKNWVDQMLTSELTKLAEPKKPKKR
jgi:hypothetical protein